MTYKKSNKKNNKTREPLKDWELIRLGIRAPRIVVDDRVHRKTNPEKGELRKARKVHNKHLRDNGVDPNKQLNVSDPQTIRFMM